MKFREAHLLRDEQAGDVAQGDLRHHEAGEPDRPQAAVDGEPAARPSTPARTPSCRSTSRRRTSCSTRPATRRAPDGKRTNPDGSPLAVNFSVQAGCIDYQAIADVVVKGLNDARGHRQGHRLRPGLGRRAEEDRRVPADARVPARRVRAAPRTSAPSCRASRSRRRPRSCPTSSASATRPSTRPSTKLAGVDRREPTRRSTWRRWSTR